MAKGHLNFYSRMRKQIEKFLGYFPPSVMRHYEMVFSSAAENHLDLVRAGKKKFRSYTELKRHQKRVRIFVSIFVLALLCTFVGILIGPIIFPKPAEPAVYIPNGKGDIVLGNVSKNQATVIFKTLDSANGGKPLATKAIVEIYTDPDYTNLERRTNEDDYAVTHIITADSLQENKLYYIRIIANDAATPVHSETISSWGDGGAPITVYTTGELANNCGNVALNNPDSGIDTSATKLNETNVSNVDITATKQPENLSLNVTDVQNENYLQPDNKVQTIISWDTNVPASTSITYWEENSSDKKDFPVADQSSTKHAVVMTSLKAGATYYFTAQSQDSKGNIVTSDEYSLRTPNPQENVAQKISDNFHQLLGQIKL